jgi:hypothetical protein
MYTRAYQYIDFEMKYPVCEASLGFTYLVFLTTMFEFFMIGLLYIKMNNLESNMLNLYNHHYSNSYLAKEDHNKYEGDKCEECEEGEEDHNEGECEEGEEDHNEGEEDHNEGECEEGEEGEEDHNEGECEGEGESEEGEGEGEGESEGDDYESDETTKIQKDVKNNMMNSGLNRIDRVKQYIRNPRIFEQNKFRYKPYVAYRLKHNE